MKILKYIVSDLDSFSDISNEKVMWRVLVAYFQLMEEEQLRNMATMSQMYYMLLKGPYSLSLVCRMVAKSRGALFLYWGRCRCDLVKKDNTDEVI